MICRWLKPLMIRIWSSLWVSDPHGKSWGFPHGFHVVDVTSINGRYFEYRKMVGRLVNMSFFYMFKFSPIWGCQKNPQFMGHLPNPISVSLLKGHLSSTRKRMLVAIIAWWSHTDISWSRPAWRFTDAPASLLVPLLVGLPGRSIPTGW